jgi:uncharacterized Rmd1/YagE family protein
MQKEIEMKCLTYSTATGYKLASVYTFLQKKEKNVHRFSDVVFYQSDAQFVYIFAFGAVVVWGQDSNQSLSFIKSIEHYADEPTSQFETDEFFYEVGTKTVIDEIGNTIILENDTDAFYKLSLSYALAQSIKLASHEKELKLTIDKMAFIPRSLAKTGKTSLKRNEIAKKMGELYLQKSSINSNLNIMHTPRVIWDHSEIEPHYHMAADFLDLHSRVESLNMGLTMIQDLLEILEDQLNHKHSSMLEWIIIVLIFVEVILFIAKDLLKA